VESLVTELAIVLVVRTRKSFWRSRPSTLLWRLTVMVGLFAIAIPYLPGAAWFGFVPLSMPVMGGLMAITVAYLAASEAAKRWFFSRERPRRRS
jgi:Mg2+-importing ATPase